MVRKFNYRGLPMEKLRSMTLDETTKLLTSRARRAIKRGNKRYRRLLETVKVAKKAAAEGASKVVKTHVRDAVILPDWVGLKFGIHNGKEFKVIDITPEKIGRRLGEYSHTTGPVRHSGPGVGATRGSKFIPLK
jgi:small subunit ribosomal protein S19